MNRRRLHSDKSVDSDDSCNIVFENSSDIEYDYTTTDDEDEDENCDPEILSLKLKVLGAYYIVMSKM
uniref:Uncharacterized protein n=1 Tax=Nesodiprion zhejiangensis nucleopolyhedrovirus TaxID=3135970 RepID=A0AAN0N6M8_9BACU